MRDVERIGRDALSEVRAAVVGYRAQGLHGELEGARRALAAVGIEASVEAELPALPIAYESAMALALARVGHKRGTPLRRPACRHPHRRGTDGIVLELTDDGHGGSAPEGVGLTGMRERDRGALAGCVERAAARAACACSVTLPHRGPADGEQRRGASRS